MQYGYRAPGNGLIIGALEAGLKKAGGQGLICDKIVTGKPNPAIFDLIRGQHNIDKSETSKCTVNTCESIVRSSSMCQSPLGPWAMGP